MEIKQTLILDGDEPLSKVLTHLDEVPAVIVTRKGKYYGIIDHRSVSDGFKKPHDTRCEKAVVKPPLIVESASILERVELFLQGHFKALPVVDANDEPVAITTRVELLKDMVRERMMPSGNVSDLMSAPVFSIEEKSKIADVKTELRERSARRLVVMRGGKPIGLVSTFDIGAWKDRHNLAGGRKDVHMSEPIDFDDMELSGFVRPDVITIDSASRIDDAAKRMIEREVSGVIVVDKDKPVGILSALDIFKYLHDVMEEKMQLQISGLSEESMLQYNDIQGKIGHVLEKFGKSFNIRDARLHVKEDKKAFQVNIHFSTDEGPVSLSGERATLKETVDELAVELDKVLNKKKEMRRPKPRASHYGGSSGTDYERRGR
jgi:CBS domain-containing protein/ribosome-associated translation inhibitor RaiA